VEGGSIMLTDFTRQLTDQIDLSRLSMAEAIRAMMRGAATHEEMAAFLLALKAKGESAAEIAGAAEAMRAEMTPIRTERTGIVDTCGTGGVSSTLFNVSTTAALVTAACGVPVAKHGNRSVTSKSGSADVLAALGVNISAPIAVVENCLNELGICFCFAPLMHPAMKHVALVRKQLGVPTIFNLLGPLCNPANAPHQILGVGRDGLRPKMAEVLRMLGTTRSAIITGEGNLGEITIAGPTAVHLVEGDSIREQTWTPATFGVERSSLASLSVDGPEQSAAKVRFVLAGETGPARDIVIANAAAAIWVAGKVATLPAAAQAAAEAIDSGAAADLLSRWAAMTST
jgi:anthranilate phosphoribosyltransferase